MVDGFLAALGEHGRGEPDANEIENRITRGDDANASAAASDAIGGDVTGAHAPPAERKSAPAFDNTTHRGTTLDSRAQPTPREDEPSVPQADPEPTRAPTRSLLAAALLIGALGLGFGSAWLWRSPAKDDKQAVRADASGAASSGAAVAAGPPSNAEVPAVIAPSGRAPAPVASASAAHVAAQPTPVVDAATPARSAAAQSAAPTPAAAAVSAQTAPPPRGGVDLDKEAGF
jgi:hypothetical protein